MAKKFPNSSLATVLKLLNNARSDDETRYYINGVYYDAENGEHGSLVATDGGRLVVYTITDRRLLDALLKGQSKPASGYVDLDAAALTMRPSLDSALKDAQFPMYQRVIPAPKTLESAPFDKKYIDNHVHTGGPTTTILFFARETGIIVNPEYLLDVPLLDRSTTISTASENRERRPITVDIDVAGGHLLVVVMPIALTE